MAMRILLTLTSVVFIQAPRQTTLTELSTACLCPAESNCNVLMKPSYTGRLSSNVHHSDTSQPVAFPVAMTDIKFNGTSLYDQATKTITVPRDGRYWIILDLFPNPGSHTELHLYVNGRDSKFGVWAEGYRTSQSAPFALRYGNKLTVMARGSGRMQYSTFWSVAYIGLNGHAFAATVPTDRSWFNPLPFSEIITYRNVVHDYEMREFTITVNSIYLISLSADSETNRDTREKLSLQVKYPGKSKYTPIMSSYGYKKACYSTTGVFNLPSGTTLQVSWDNHGNRSRHVGPKSMLSFANIGVDTFDYTTAFLGETAWQSRNRSDPVRFTNIKTRISVPNSMVSSGVFPVPFDSIYIISLRPFTTVEVTIWDFHPVLNVKNKAGNTLLSARLEEKGDVVSGISAFFRLQAGDEIKVLARYYYLTNKILFSIANLGPCCAYG